MDIEGMMSSLTLENIFEDKKGWIALGNAFIAYCKYYDLIENAKIYRGYNSISSVDYDDAYGDDEGTTTSDVNVVVSVDGKIFPSGTYRLSLYNDWNSVFEDARILYQDSVSSEITSKDFRFDEPSMVEEMDIDLVIDRLMYGFTRKLEDKNLLSMEESKKRKIIRESHAYDECSPYNIYTEPEKFVGYLNNYLPEGVFATLVSTPRGYEKVGGFKIIIEDTQAPEEDVNNTFEIFFEYVDDVDEILASIIFKPHGEGNLKHIWISYGTDWEDFGKKLIRAVWRK